VVIAAIMAGVEEVAVVVAQLMPSTANVDYWRGEDRIGWLMLVPATVSFTWYQPDQPRSPIARYTAIAICRMSSRQLAMRWHLVAGDGGAFGFGQTGGSQKFLDHRCLGLAVFVDVGRASTSVPLDGGVLIAQGLVGGARRGPPGDCAATSSQPPPRRCWFSTAAPVP